MNDNKAGTMSRLRCVKEPSAWLLSSLKELSLSCIVSAAVVATGSERFSFKEKYPWFDVNGGIEYSLLAEFRPDLTGSGFNLYYCSFCYAASDGRVWGSPEEPLRWRPASDDMGEALMTVMTNDLEESKIMSCEGQVTSFIKPRSAVPGDRCLCVRMIPESSLLFDVREAFLLEDGNVLLQGTARRGPGYDDESKIGFKCTSAAQRILELLKRDFPESYGNLVAEYAEKTKRELSEADFLSIAVHGAWPGRRMLFNGTNVIADLTKEFDLELPEDDCLMIPLVNDSSRMLIIKDILCDSPWIAADASATRALEPGESMNVRFSARSDLSVGPFELKASIVTDAPGGSNTVISVRGRYLTQTAKGKL